ncbi:MAG TPA: SDR family oxidoreductase [Haliangiales bacterium]|nr:SDR family oxidoreductase [Haliangiales bacterium]
MKGKTVLVTGATQGIGKVTALELARMGASVAVTARDRARGEATAEEIKDKAGAAVELHLCDFASQADIRRFAAEFLAKHDKLDVLVNNAGAINMERRLTPDGIEMTFAVNHLGYFLLTHLLLPALEAAAPSRIVVVASDAHARGHIDFDDLMGEKSYAGFRAYGQSKLANILFTYELARRLDGKRVTANCLHPGVVATGFGRNDKSWLSYGIKLVAPFFLTPEEGAQTSIYLASSPDVEGTTGKYFAKSKEKKSNRESYDRDVQRRLWEVSEKLTGLDKPGT